MATQNDRLNTLTIVECPRDAMQGLDKFIPTPLKIRYLNALLEVGFDYLDFGSFVSPKAVPQMADTKEVLAGLNWEESKTELLGIVAGKRGIADALEHQGVRHLGFPFSISPTFQMRNAKKSIQDSFDVVKYLLDACESNDRKAVVYLSMGFGNPYDDDWSLDLVEDWCGKLIEIGVQLISLSDTVGKADPTTLNEVYTRVEKSFADTEFGMHLHTRYDNWKEKVDSAWRAGCRRFDGAMKGFGGCPFAKDELVGNLPTEKIISFCTEKKIHHNINLHRFQSAYNMSADVFLTQ